jgi:hypothetical protein
MSPFSLFEAGVAFAQLVLLVCVYRAIRALHRHRRLSDPAFVPPEAELRVHVPELAEVAYSLNAMRTHLYQIGRALKARREFNHTPSGSLDIEACFSSDGSFNDKKKEN